MTGPPKNVEVRIKKGVKPYGGRRVKLAGRHTYPNGREVVRVHAPGRAGSEPWMHVDIREYEAHEVEEIKDRLTGQTYATDSGH